MGWADQFEMMMQPQQRPEALPVASGKWSDQFESGGAPVVPQKPAPSPYAEPDAPSWIGRRIQDIRGKQDPRYKDLPEFTSTPAANEQDIASKLNQGKILGTSDAGYGDMLSKQLGDRLISRTQDANGYDIVTYRGDDGKPISAYVNKPGLGWQDVDRAVAGAIPYIASSTVVGRALKGAGLGLQALGQAGASGGTSILTDVGSSFAGSDQGVDGTKAAVMTGLGAAAPVVGAAGSYLWRKGVTEPSLFNATTGQLTPKGAEIARKAGMDPAVMSREAQAEMAKTYAMTGDAAQAAIMSNTRPLGISSVTKGQLTKDKEQLAMEEAMRRGIYGNNAKEIILANDAKQASEIAAAAETTQRQAIGVPQTMTRARGQGQVAPEPPRTNLSSGEDIQGYTQQAFQSAKAGEKQAWEAARDAGPLRATPDAIQDLPTILNSKLQDFRIQPGSKAAQMAEHIDEFIAGGAPKNVASWIKQNPAGDVEAMRRQLLNTYRGAQDPADKAAAKIIYEGFGEWIDSSAQKALLAGDPMAAAALKSARDVTRSLKEVFEPSQMGRMTPGGKKVQDILNASDGSAESIVSGLFGATPGGMAKTGSIDAVRSLKAAYDRYLPQQEAAQAWDAIRSTYVMRLMKAQRGESATDLASPQLMLNAINNAFANQRGMINALFEPAEQAALKRFAEAMKIVTYKDPNPSGTAYTGAGFAKQAVQTVFRAFGGESLIGQMLVQAAKPVLNIYGGAQAKRAVSTMLVPRQVNPALVGAGIAAARPQE